MKKRKDFKSFLSDQWVALVPYVMLLLIITLMGILNPNTLSLSYLANKCDSSFSLILVALGQTFVLLTGGFDLSVGGVICITNCLAAAHMQDQPGSIHHPASHIHKQALLPVSFPYGYCLRHTYLCYGSPHDFLL